MTNQEQLNREMYREANALAWQLGNLFDSQAKFCGPSETPLDTYAAVHVYPYDDHWHVRAAFFYEGKIHLSVRHNPTGEETCNQWFELDERHKVFLAAAEAVRPSDYC